MADGHDHSHSHGIDDDRPFSARWHALASRRVLLGSITVILVATVVGLIALWPGKTKTVVNLEGENYFGERVNAVITGTHTGICSYDIGTGDVGDLKCTRADFRVTSGTPEGDRSSIEVPVNGAGAPRLHAGDHVVMYFDATAPLGAQFQFADFQRGFPMAILALLFAVVVMVFGRKHGVFALVGVGVSMVVLLAFTLPALLNGESPLLVALAGTSAVALPALYLAHGLSERTTVAVLGTVASLLLTCVLGLVFVKLTKLTGLGSEEVGFLQAFGGQLDFSGLLLAGMVIGALGVLDDVTVTQVAAIHELNEANPRFTIRQLYSAGVRIGREHIASTVNTLVLAYAGAALPLLLLFRTSGQALAHVVTSEAIATEVVRALVGSIGLVSSVPITTALAALVVKRSTDPLPSPSSHGQTPGLGQTT